MTEEIWSGIDVAKETFEASWVDGESRLEEFGRIAHAEFPRTAEGVRQYLQWLDRQAGEQAVRVRCVMEATGRYSLELIAWLVEQRPRLAPALLHPKQARYFQKSLGLRNKTDAVDARSLGLMGRQRRPPAWQAPAAEYQQLRELVRQRRNLVRILVSEKLRLQENPPSKPVQRVLRSHIRHLQKLQQRLEKAIGQLVEDSPRLSRDIELLGTIPGVGPVVAVTVLAELGDLRRFHRSRQVSAAAGLSPSNRESGKTVKPARIHREGPAEVRSILYMAALACCRQPNNRMARTYLHLVEDNGLSNRQALVAVMRKTLVIMRALLIGNCPYQDDFQARQKSLAA